MPNWKDFTPAGEETGWRRQKVGPFLYACVLIFALAVGVVGGYATAVYEFGRFTELAEHGRSEDEPRHYTQADILFYLALPGLIGGAAGLAGGFYVCYRIRRDVAEERKLLGKNPSADHPFGTP